MYVVSVVEFVNSPYNYFFGKHFSFVELVIVMRTNASLFKCLLPLKS